MVKLSVVKISVNHPKIRQLFPNAKETEVAYFKKTGMFPIMYAFGVYFFGVRFDILDILMFGLGTLFAVLIDKQLLKRLIPHWRYTH